MKRINETIFNLGIPDMTGDAITFINQNLKQSDQCFEWGAGASTFWIAQRCKHIYSSEYFEQFYYYLREQQLQRSIDNISLKFVPADSTPHEGYIAQYSSAKGQSYKAFAHSIEDFGTAIFDWIFIDGRARSACLDVAMSVAKPGSWIVFDDTERVPYSQAILSYSPRFERVWSFPGPKATTGRHSETTVARLA